MRVFVDANIYLNFFEKSNDGITSLDTLKEYVEKKKVTLILPQVTQDEFFRNLPGTRRRYLKAIDSAISSNKSAHASIAYLSFGKAASKRGRIKEFHKSMLEELKMIKDKYPSDCGKLVADTIMPLTKVALVPEETSEIFERAKRRRFLGNPPGKSGARMHIGDEFVWELILENYVDDDLVVVSNDGDWLQSKDDGSKGVSDFLKTEWQRRTKKNIDAVETLGEFINAYIKPPEDKKVTKEEIAKERSTLSSPSVYDPLLHAGWIPASPGLIAGDNVSTFDSPYIQPIGGIWRVAAEPWECSACKNCNPNDSGVCLKCGLPRPMISDWPGILAQ